MFKKARPFFIIVETPLHAGSGNDLGIVDLPIQRERHTDFPKIEGSGLKGSIREVFEDIVSLDEKEKKYVLANASEPVKKLKEKFPTIESEWKKEKVKIKGKDEEVSLTRFQEAISLTFGPENAGNDAHAGALGFTDARTLLFPVKSMRGVFAWITCPKVLERFKKDLELAFGRDYVQSLPWSIPNTTNHYSSHDVLISGKVILEEYTFDVTPNDSITKFAGFISQKTGIPDIGKKLIYLSDDDFKDFVNLSTEVITRTKISNETGTVQSGALFTEEYLPTETILYSLALTTPIFQKDEKRKGVFAKKSETGSSEEDKVMEFFTAGLPEVMQIGGNATIGKGIVRVKPLEKPTGSTQESKKEVKNG